MKVAGLLQAAASLLDDPDPATVSVWPRGAAVLMRQAIETTLDGYWTAVAGDMRHATTHQQWLALPAYLGRSPVVPAAEYAWSSLSEACHQRAYDVGLTEAELRSHLASATAFYRLVADAVLARAAAGRA